MPIKVACKCGQAFTVKDEMAGKTLQCPKCKQPLPIPARGATAAVAPAPRPAQSAPAAPVSGALLGLFEEAGFKEHKGPRCPQCGEPLRKSDAILCTSCGFNLQSGQKVEGARVISTEEGGHAIVADAMLDRAAKAIVTDKEELLKNSVSGPPAWILFLALSAICAFVATMFLRPRDEAFLYCGGGVAIFCALMQFYFYVRFVIVAFQESTTHGLLCIFVPPFYSLYYLIARWDKVKGFFLSSLFYGFFELLGLGMVWLSPMLKPAPPGGSMLPNRIEMRQMADSSISSLRVVG